MSIIKPNQSYYQIETERLSFVSLNDGHKKQWATFFHDNPTERFLGLEGSTKSAEEKAEFWVTKQVDREKNGSFGQLAVIEKETGKFVGLAGIIPREIDSNQEYEVTYSFFSSSWGKGYATEAAVKFKEYMFENTEVKTLISIIHVENEGSIRVAEKNNMKVSSEMEFMDMPVFIFRTY